MAENRNRILAPVLGLVILFGILAGTVYVGWSWLSNRADNRPAKPPTAGCMARSGEQTAWFTTQQVHWAAVIVAESIRRDLPARAATIALATAMQESSLRNITHGDRDSIGLFQQRPSQGWGSVEQILDPWYSAGKFYEALVRVKGWQNGDINGVAQKVQRSGHPEAYRKHVEEAKVLASVLTGHSGAGLTCIQNQSPSIKKSRTTEVITKGLKGKASVTSSDPRTLKISGALETNLWAAVNLAMAAQADLQLGSVEVGGLKWTHSAQTRAPWQGTPTPGVNQATFTLP